MNYHRFYALLKQLSGDAYDMKSQLVHSFTDGRTTHLHEMTRKEYDAMCASLEERTGWKEQLRKKRSLCLKLMQKAGVDTTDWARVNDFCQNPKIAGKVFAQLGLKDLDALQVKLRVIIGKGGLRSPSPSLPRREGEEGWVLASPQAAVSPLLWVYGSYGIDVNNEKDVN